jgi:hypothetical protein
MPSGVYERTPAHRASMRRAQAEAKANGSEASTSRRRAAADLADYTSAQIAEAVKRNDFSLARAWVDLSESLSKSE